MDGQNVGQKLLVMDFFRTATNEGVVVIKPSKGTERCVWRGSQL